jgi:hypothetical protein
MIYRELKDCFGKLSSTIIRTNENGTESFIPNDPANVDWQAYQKWLADGNTPVVVEVQPCSEIFS